MSTPREHFALDWIRSDLLQTLEEARASLEIYAENDDATRMRMCLTALHQLHGTLLMLELDGVTCLADHLEQLAQRLTTDSVSPASDAEQYLMQGILELPGYLDDLHKGGRDSRTPMLPLVNDIRRLIDLEALDMPAGSVDLHRQAPSESIDRFGEIDGVGKVKRIRAAYQQVLLSILKGEDKPSAVATMQKVAASLERVCVDTPLASLWQAFGLFINSLDGSSGNLGNDVVKLLRRVDAEIRALAADGAELLKKPVPVDLVRSLLAAARERDHSSSLADGLQEAIDSQPGSESLRFSGQEALASAAVALRGELTEIKDQLDLFVRSDNRSNSALMEIAAPLKQISSTLSLLGFEGSRALVVEQLDSLNLSPDGEPVDDESLTSLATVLVQVDENLAVHANLNASADNSVDQVVADAHRRVLSETRSGLDQVKQALVAYVSSEWDTAALAQAPAALMELHKALAMLSLQRPADLLDNCAAYVQRHLLAGNVPSWEELDQFADAVSGVDYYLERLGDESGSQQENILGQVERSLSALGYLGESFDPDFVVPDEASAEAEAAVEPELDSSAADTTDALVEPDTQEVETEVSDSAATADVGHEAATEATEATEAAEPKEEVAEESLELDLAADEYSETDADLLVPLDDESGLEEFDLDSDLFVDMAGETEPSELAGDEPSERPDTTEDLSLGARDDASVDATQEASPEQPSEQLLSDSQWYSEPEESPDAASTNEDMLLDSDEAMRADADPSSSDVGGVDELSSADSDPSSSAEPESTPADELDLIGDIPELSFDEPVAPDEASGDSEAIELTDVDFGSELESAPQEPSEPELEDVESFLELDTPEHTLSEQKSEQGPKSISGLDAQDTADEQEGEDLSSPMQPSESEASTSLLDGLDSIDFDFSGTNASESSRSDELLDDDLLGEDEQLEPSATFAESASEQTPGPSEELEERDEEIVEIFSEEVSEVLEAVSDNLVVWNDRRDDQDALAEIRRGFHTLKGSGRIVGAMTLGELAWSVENLLNRVIDKTVTASDDVLTVTANAARLIDGARDAFVERRAADEPEINALMESADLLASGALLDDADELPNLDARIDEDAAELVGDDAVVLELFLGEADGLVAELEQIAVADDLVLQDDFLRASHTLAGSSAAVSADAMRRVAGCLEQLAFDRSNRATSSQPLDAAASAYVRDAVFCLRRLLTDLADDRSSEDVSRFERELAELQATDSQNDLASRENAETTEPGSDEVVSRADDKAGLLADESLQALFDYEQHLEAWRWGTIDLAAAESLCDSLARLADNAHAAEIEPVAELASALAEGHQALSDDSLQEADLELLRSAHERLLAQLDNVAVGQQAQRDEGLVEALQALSAVAGAPASITTDVDAADADTAEAESVHSASGAIPDATDVTEPEDASSEDALELSEPEREIASNLPSEPNESEQLTDESDSFDLADLVSEDELAAETDLPIDDLESLSLAANADSENETAPQADDTAQADAAPSLDVDAEIVGIFFEEADEILEGFDASLQQWLAERDNAVHQENLLRGLHTLKGGARLAGLVELGDETHRLESFLVDAQNAGTATDGAFFADLANRHESLLSLLASNRQTISRQTEAAANQPATPETEPVADAQETAPAARAPVKPVAQSEMVRVSSGLLEELVNLAGESSIMRARIEQSISDFGTALGEMETTIDRVREQLRRLEIETETQVHFRSDTQGPAYKEFDPLEMDRYSQLQELTRSLSESASDMLDLKETLSVKSREAETLLLQQGRLNTELQEGLMRTRMVPFSRLLPRLRRIVRQVSRELDKQVEFHAYNAEGELDRTVLERMVPPLEHMLRNAVDHGIESNEERRGYSKPVVGRIDLRLSREGGDVVIEISDDGAGIDVESVRAKAIERGLMAADAELSDEQILEFVLAPGFTTAQSVTQISGRGVGMDVVHSEVKQLGGSIDIASQPGKGTRITVRLPFTVSVNRALMVSVADDMYAIPLNTIEGIVLLSAQELADAQNSHSGVFEYAGIPYRVRYLGNYIGRDYGSHSDAASVPVVLVRSGDHAVAVHVDSVVGSREIVVKALGPQFAGVGGISGATILGDGNVVVILDLVALVRTQGVDGFVGRARPRVARAEVRTVMVVDDSVTVRKVTSRLLERQGMEVVVAKDGVEAIALLQEQRPDIMLLDIEMPRMDGFEVARQVRHDDRLKSLPIVMITSRTGQKHQQHAKEVGVNQFLGKPFQESELLATIDELVH